MKDMNNMSETVLILSPQEQGASFTSKAPAAPAGTHFRTINSRTLSVTSYRLLSLWCCGPHPSIPLGFQLQASNYLTRQLSPVYCDFLAESHHTKYIYALEENSYVCNIKCIYTKNQAIYFLISKRKGERLFGKCSSIQVNPFSFLLIPRPILAYHCFQLLYLKCE